MRRFTVSLGLTGILCLGAFAPAASAGLTNARPTGNLLVLLGHHRASVAAGRSAITAVIAQVGGEPAGMSVPQIGLITVRPPLGMSVAALARRLAHLPGVASVQPERRYAPRSAPNDPALAASSPFTGTVQWGLAREGFYSAWDINRGDGALVGVIDTGIDANHPDLQTKLAVAPVDQQQEIDSTGPAGTDQSGHGTHVASLACAATNNGIGMAGAGYDCKLVIEKTDFTDSSIAASITDATDRGVGAINMSFGPASPTSVPAPQSEVRAIEYAVAHKVVLVAAAGDSGRPGTEQGDPANVLQPAGSGSNINAGIGLDVTAADYSDHRASFAGFGSEISLAAYGAFSPGKGGVLGLGPRGIFGAFPGRSTDLESLPEPCLCRTTFQRSNSYAYLQGTSMAAPQVAAAAAMMRKLNPYASLTDILRTIKQTAQRPAGTGWSPDLGWGILNAGAALDAIRNLDRLAPYSRLLAPRATSRRIFTLRWGGADRRQAGLVTSGIAYYEIFVKDGTGRQRMIARTPTHMMRFKGRPGHSYAFTSIAVDRAGNREVKPANDATRVVIRGRPRH